MVVAVEIDNLQKCLLCGTSLTKGGGPCYQLPMLHEVDHGMTQQIGQFIWVFERPIQYNLKLHK